MWIRRLLLIPILAGLIGAGLWAAFNVQVAPQASVMCHVGAYRLSDGRVLTLTPSSHSHSLRYVLMNGETGRLMMRRSWGGNAAHEFEGGAGWASDAPVVHTISFANCAATKVMVSLSAQPAVEGEKIEFQVADAEFPSHGLKLKGRLVMPMGDEAVPVAVLVHGSEFDSARIYNRLQYLFPANGIGVFVYDKRGTGGSEGQYSQNFHLLSDDAVAAMNTARVLAGPRAKEVGFQGGSQAGWIEPLAATKTKADFIVVGYGLTESPLAEDRDEVFDDLRRAGYGDDVIAKAREITDATARVMASDFKEGYDALDAVREKYGKEPWYNKIEGEFTGQFLAMPNWLLRILGPYFDVGTSWEYDPVPALQTYQGPHLWVLAGDDSSAPPANTLRILREVQATHPELDVVLFPKTDHGIVTYVEKDGERELTGFADGYFELLVSWIKSKRVELSVQGPEVDAGSAEVEPVAPTPVQP